MRPLLLFMTFWMAACAWANEASPVGKPQWLAGSVYLLQGRGGNIGVSAGEDGILMVDDQFADLAPDIAKALSPLSPGPLRYIINSHAHHDHTGSNAWFEQHHGVTIVAHDAVREWLKAEDNPYPALPVVTFAQGVTFHLNNETIRVEHLPMGHTNSDSVIWFDTAKVLHTGDLFFQGRFPFIDVKRGGTLQGYMQNVAYLLEQLDLQWQIIPGHGELVRKADYQLFYQMLQETSAAVAQQKAQGKTLDEVLAHGVAPQWRSWGWEFISEERWLTTLYSQL